MKTSETIDKIAPALLAAQKLIGAAKKDAENPFFRSKYADLGEVIEVCKAHLNNNGITVLQPVSNGDGGATYVETILLHESGQFVCSSMRVTTKQTGVLQKIDENDLKNLSADQIRAFGQVADDPQAQGSAITYARRYSLQSMILIPAEDDDAESAMKRSTDKPQAPRKPPEDQPFPAMTPVIDASLGLGPEHKKLFLLLGQAVEQWNRPMGDILHELTTFKTKKDGKEITVNGKYVLKEVSAKSAAVCAQKLERELNKGNSQEPPDDDNVPY